MVFKGHSSRVGGEVTLHRPSPEPDKEISTIRLFRDHGSPQSQRGYLRPYRLQAVPLQRMEHVSLTKFMTTRAAFALSGSPPLLRAFPGVLLSPPWREACATMPLSDFPVVFGRSFGLPSLRPTMNLRPSFRNAHRQDAGRAQRRCLSRTSPGPSDSIHGTSGTSRVSGSSSLRAPKSIMPPEPCLPALHKGHGIVFGGRGTLNLREDKFFGTESPGSRICPFPSINPDVAAGTAGKATDLAGLRLGRTGFAPVRRLLHVSERCISFHSRKPAFLPGRNHDHFWENFYNIYCLRCGVMIPQTARGKKRVREIKAERGNPLPKFSRFRAVRSICGLFNFFPMNCDWICGSPWFMPRS